MAATIFVYYSTFESYALKPIVPPQIKKTPLPFLSHGSLRLFSYFFLLSLFVLSRVLQFLALLSSTSCVTAALTLASDTLGLK